MTICLQVCKAGTVAAIGQVTDETTPGARPTGPGSSMTTGWPASRAPTQDEARLNGALAA